MHFHLLAAPSVALRLGLAVTLLATALLGQPGQTVAAAGPSVDDGFDPDASAGGVYALAIQADGDILVGGNFSALDGQPRARIGRLKPDGSLDTGFDPGANGEVYGLAVQPDGKLVVAGWFTTLAGQTRNYIGRLNPDGSLETAFDPGANDVVYALALQADGKIVVGGRFTRLAGQPRSHIGRLNADGSLDADFNPGANDWVATLAAQGDNKLLVGGFFTVLRGQEQHYIGRLDADGSLDTGFDPEANESVLTMALQADGKVVIGGYFSMVGGQERVYLARLQPDGRLDTDFNPGINDVVNSLAVQADGHIAVGGGFTALGGQPRSRLGRLNPDGSLDTLFDAGVEGLVDALAVDAGGQLVVGGSFTALGGQPRNSLGRLVADTPASQTLTVTQDTITWARGGAAPEVTRVTFEQSSDGTSYTSLGAGTRVASAWQLSGLALPHAQALFVRARGYYGTGALNASGSMVEAVSLTWLATVWTVTKTGDSNDGVCDADCSLREAVIAANTDPGASTILVPPGTYVLTMAGADEDAAATGDLDITDDVTLTGVTSATTVISTTGQAFGDRLFEITQTASVTLTNLTLTGGAVATNPPATPGGGALINWGALTLDQVLIIGNTAPIGAGVQNFGALTVTTSSIVSNTASSDGGGVVNEFAGTLTVGNTRLEGNSATGNGGGIANKGRLFVHSSTFDEGHANYGPGVYNQATAHIAESSFTGNQALWYGAVTGEGLASTTIITASTFERNTAKVGAAIQVQGVLTLTDSLIFDNTATLYGGGIEVYSSGFISHTKIISNTAPDGGGLFTQGHVEMVNGLVMSNTASGDGGGLHIWGQLYLTNMEVVGNSAGHEGGGVYNNQYGRLSIADSKILTNTANVGGGLANWRVATVTETLLAGNSARSYGGGLYSSGLVTLTGVSVSDNHSSYGGGGVFNDVGGNVRMSGGQVVTNQSTGQTEVSRGGGLANFGQFTLEGLDIRANQASLGAGLYTSGTAVISNTTFTANASSAYGGGLFSLGATEVADTTWTENTASEGGGLYNGGELSVTASTLLSNTASVLGGGIMNLGTLNLGRSQVAGNTASNGGGLAGWGGLTITLSILSRNVATANGGAIYFPDYGVLPLSIDSSTLFDNQAQMGGGLWGGGPSVAAAVTLNHSSVLSNSAAAYGGGLFVIGHVALRNVTVSGNRAGAHGGGLAAMGSLGQPANLQLNNVTLAANTADSDNNGVGEGGGAYISPTASLRLTNTVLAANFDLSGQAPDCAGTLSTGGYNLVEHTAGCTLSGSGAGDVTNTPGLLGPLADNGGPTLTQAPLPGSPAHNAGSTALPGTGGDACETTDQRGIIRPQDGRCDMGAYEDTIPMPRYIQFSAAEFAVPESAAGLVFTATLDQPAGITLTVAYTTTAITAEPGVDYLAASGTLTFTPGTQVVKGTIVLLDDAWDEDDESLALVLFDPLGAVLATPYTATITLLDDDPTPLAQFSEAAQTVPEGAGLVTVTLVLTAPSSFTVTVPYTMGGTATGGGVDHDLADGVVAFGPGETTTTVSFALTPDGVHEPDETVVLSLGTPVHAGLGLPLTHTVTITDDDALPGVCFTTAAYTTTENTGSAVLTITLTAAYPLTVTVDYATSSGTAVAGSDYVPISGTVIFPPGQTLMTLTVMLLDDLVPGPAEALTLSLANPINAVLLAPTVAALYVLDNEHAVYLPLLEWRPTGG